MYGNYTLLFLGLIFIFYSCSSGQLSVETIPKGAEMQTISEDGTIVSLGVTPYSTKTLGLFKSKEAFVHLKISKKGYTSERVLLEKPYWDSSIELNLKLNKKHDSSTANQDLEMLAKGIAEAQKHIGAKSYDRAEILLVSLTRSYPDVSVLYDFLGNANYLSKKFERALYYYKKAGDIDPNSRTRKRIVEKLRVITGSIKQQR